MPREAAPQRRRRDFFTEAVIGLTTVALLSLGGVTASAVTEPTPAPQVDAVRLGRKADLPRHIRCRHLARGQLACDAARRHRSALPNHQTALGRNLLVG